MKSSYMWALVALAALVCCQASAPVITNSTLPGMKKMVSFMNGAYKLHWTVDETLARINLAIQAQTTGWVGFGLGEPTSGSMGGADILLAWIDDTTGAVTVKDSFATGFAAPTPDDRQDWTVYGTASAQANGVTTVYASRALDTGETRQDRPFYPGSNRVIIAWGSTDTLAQHSANNRMIAAVNFYGQSPFDFQQNVASQPNVQKLTFQISNYTIPALSTVYAFQSFLIADTALHAVAIDIVLNAATADKVHHLVLHDCKNTSTFWQYYNNPSYPAGYPQSSLVGSSECNSPIWAWAHGGDMLVTPSNAGIRLGSGGMRFLIAEMHYNNPGSTPVAGLVDRTAFTLYVTPQLRQYDVGMLTVGDPALGYGGQFITKQDYEFVCPSACTSRFAAPANVFASFLHMHTQGIQMWTTQSNSQGVMQGMRGKVEYWDFNNQITEPKCFTIQPGDQLNTHCRYAQTAISSTRWGLGSADEMCMQFLMYYPRNNISMCGFFRANVQGTVSTVDICGASVIYPDNQARVDGTSTTSCFGSTTTCAANMTTYTSACNAPITASPTPRPSSAPANLVTLTSAVLLMMMIMVVLAM